jgi:ribokinase
MPNSRLTIIGSSNVDFTMKVDRLPSRGETVSDGAFMQTFGGKGANQAVAAARAGANVSFVTCLGSDCYTPAILGNLHRDGIDTSAIRVSSDTVNGFALVMVDWEGGNYLTVAPGANYNVSLEHICGIRDLISSSGLLLLQMEIPTEANRMALSIACDAGVPVVLNYAPGKDRDFTLITGVDTLIVNQNEAAFLASTDPEDLEQAARAIRFLAGLGPRRVILTLGAYGSLALQQGVITYQPAFEVVAVDTTAAGDIFCGAYGTALVEGIPFDSAIRFATAAAALGVTKIGAQSSIPSRAEIDAFLGKGPSCRQTVLKHASAMNE